VDLYSLLDREISGNTDLGTPASRAAASEQALGADPLVADLGDRLRARGARVWHQYDGAIDVVAAADPLGTMGQEDADLPWPVAIESDGTEQYRTTSVRERSRLRPQLLERLGWRYMPLWTIEVFTDPSACADRIAKYLGLEKVVLPGRVASPGFLDDDVDQALNDIDAAADSAPASNVTHFPGPASGRRAGIAGARAGHQAVPAADRQDSKEAAQVGSDDKTNSTNSEARPTDGGEAAEAPAPATRAGQKPAEGILPARAAEDDPRAWGDREDDHDAWLKEQKPPHWG
jgi:hypothetical protein